MKHTNTNAIMDYYVRKGACVMAASDSNLPQFRVAETIGSSIQFSFRSMGVILSLSLPPGAFEEDMNLAGLTFDQAAE